MFHQSSNAILKLTIIVIVFHMYKISQTVEYFNKVETVFNL